MKKLILILFVTSLSFGQTIYIVSAKEGLNVREQPSLESKKIATLVYGQKVIIESKTGKKAWVSDNLGKVKGLILVYAYKKPEYSGKNRILIDDRAQTIKEWRSKGGIGILHTSTSDTIEKLKKLGL